MDRFDYSTLTSVNIEFLRQTAARGRALIVLVTPAVIELGDIITDARDIIPHGYFGTWCIEALGIDRRLAQKYMNLAKAAKTHGREQVEKLSVTAAHYIAAPSTPDAVVAEVLDRVTAGNIPTAAEVKDLIRETRTFGTRPGADQELDDEIEVLSGLLIDALDASYLTRLRAFLLGASPQAIHEFCCSLEVTTPIVPAAPQDNSTNQWMSKS